jgi:hypothetical protein
MGGAEANIRDKYGVAMEGVGLLGLAPDVTDIARVGLRAARPALGRAAQTVTNLVDEAVQGAIKTPLTRMEGIIGSTGAKTADLKLLAKAEDMKAAGASADDIYSQTRWWLDHPDGRPRFEIDDSKSSIMEGFANLKQGGVPAGRYNSVTYKPNPDGTFDVQFVPPNPEKTSDIKTLKSVDRDVLTELLPRDIRNHILHGRGEPDIIGANLDDAKRIDAPFDTEGLNTLPLDKVLDHQNAYMNYYDARKTATIYGGDGIGGSLGYIDDGTNQPIMSIKGGRAHETGLHELQHVVQQTEGMAKGGNPYDFARNPAINPRYAKYSEEYDNFYHKNPLSREYNQITSTADYQRELAQSNRLFNQEYAPVIDAIEAKITKRGDYKKYGAEMDKVLKDFKKVQSKRFPLLSRAEELARSEGFPRKPTSEIPPEYLTPEGGYHHLAGEAEARLVQDRMNMTMEERLANPFYKNFDVPLDEQIVRMEGGTAQSEDLMTILKRNDKNITDLLESP